MKNDKLETLLNQISNKTGIIKDDSVLEIANSLDVMDLIKLSALGIVIDYHEDKIIGLDKTYI